MTDDYVLRVNKGVEPKDRASMREFIAKTNESREAMTYELGGAFMETDLAGNTGGGTGGLNADMPLSGVSGTKYTDLVGETGALSSAEMFARGGSTDHKYLNHSEDYEVRYAKGRNRHGYGNLRFDGGGALSKEDNYKRRLMFIRQDIDRVFENSPEKYLKTPVEGFENIETLLSNIQIASDYNDNESDNWSFSRGGSTDHKYLNHSEDYEVRYAKGRNRHGYGNLKFENGGAMMANQQIIDNASQQYVNYYLGEGAVTGMYKQGGSIPNNYEGKTPEQIWSMWDRSQRKHFLYDHQDELPEELQGYDNSKKLEITKYSNLPEIIKLVLNMHKNGGQYAIGGMMPKVSTRKHRND
jgi:hypothetical protein